MKHIATRFVRMLCGAIVMLALVAGIASVSVSAADHGIYIATATPHYKHPTTGKVEDSGGENKLVSKLSGGQKQRVWIAMALAQDTRILFLDEPTTYLDIRYQLQILKLIRKLNEEYGITIVMVLHDINQSLHYSDEIIAMRDGKIIAQGEPKNIITSDLMEQVYDVKLRLTELDGSPFVVPV